jgi:tripartite-type tricarboxylate transporter receptor subunit TctC
MGCFVRILLLAVLGIGPCILNAGGVTTILPELTNVWEQAHLFIIDKDTNSVFINANERYIESLQIDFPQIHSLADLQGKTDFDFYPTNLANQYRAGDRRVIEGGVPWETVEAYQPEGGAAGYVFTSKTPLRDTNGVVYALRILFYSIPEPGQTTLPVFDTPWLQANAITIDKDTNSVFLNANELFLASLRRSFPTIKTVTNLIGRDDFYFYPPDLAEKFGADDRRVMDSGIALVTVEDNQPLGGVRTSSQVTKRPLRRPDGTIYGLRILAWNIPQITARYSPDGFELSFPKSAAEFTLERTQNFGDPTTWETVPFTPTASDIITVTMPPSTAQSYFRLTHYEPVPNDWKPNRPITLVVPWAAGGSTDQLANLMAHVLESALGQKIIVVTLPGNSGSIGTAAVLNAPLDGYTWLAGASSDLGLYRILGLIETRLSDWTPFLPLSVPQVFAVGSQSPYQTFDQLLAGFRAKPGQLRAGSAGLSSAGRIAIELLREKIGIQFTNIFFNGGSEVAAACAAGTIDVMAQGITDGVAQMRSGQVRPLATLATEALTIEGLSQPIPPVSQWVPGLGVNGNYFGFFLPRGTPMNVVNAVQRVWDQVVPNSPEIQLYASANGAPFGPITGAAAQAAAASYIQSAAWTLFDAALTKVSPATVGIVRP